MKPWNHRFITGLSVVYLVESMSSVLIKKHFAIPFDLPILCRWLATTSTLHQIQELQGKVKNYRNTWNTWDIQHWFVQNSDIKTWVTMRQRAVNKEKTNSASSSWKDKEEKTGNRHYNPLRVHPAGGELTIVNEACQHSVTTVKYSYSLM